MPRATRRMTAPKKTEHLDKEEVRNNLQDPYALLAALGLLPPGAGARKSYTITCLWCSKKTLSVFVGHRSVIGCCRKGDCAPGSIKTYSPLDLIGQAKGWAMRGPEFAFKLLPFAAELGGLATAHQPEPVATKAAPPAAAPPAVAPPAAASPAPEPQPAAEEQVPTSISLHPNRTSIAWGWLGSLGLDPHEMRMWGWKVLPDEDQPPTWAARTRRGYTLWRDTVGPDGEGGAACGVRAADGKAEPWSVTAAGGVLASEFGVEVLENGPESVDAWPWSEQEAPTIYLVYGALDFLRVEPLMQRKLLPLLGFLGEERIAEFAARLPPKCRRVLATTSGMISTEQSRVAAALNAQMVHTSRLFVKPSSDTSLAEAQSLLS